MGQRYNRLTPEERCRLCALIDMALAKSEIARRMGRHRGTIHAELERNRNADGCKPASAKRRACPEAGDPGLTPRGQTAGRGESWKGRRASDVRCAVPPRRRESIPSR
ncbi:MAG: helix-turn-helix domain-containing protein [Paracoccaceae bacterium]